MLGGIGAVPRRRGPDVRFALLGPLEAHDGDRLVELPSRQVRRLLAALVLAPNRVVSTDRLFEVLWGVEPPESAANTLQTYVLHLRNALEPGRGRRDPGRYVLRREPGYQLAVAPEEIDAARFRELADRGRKALGQAPERAVMLLGDALGLWRGDPLADFTFELFAQPAIVELSELRMPALDWSPPAQLVGRAATRATRAPTPDDQADQGPVAVGARGPSDGDALRRGMEALRRRDWAQAYAGLSAAKAHTDLDGEALDGLAESAMWLGEYESSLAARQRAHAAFLKDGETRRAAMTAIALALHYAARLRFAVAAGWYGRAERLLANGPEGPEHGYLAWTACLMSIGARQDGPALDGARRTFKVGLHTGDPTLQALGLSFQGFLLVRRGDLHEGLRLLDEGMAAAVSG